MSTWGHDEVRRVCQLETCSREMFGDLVLTCQTPPSPAFPAPVERFTGSTICPIPITFNMTMREKFGPHNSVQTSRSFSDGDDRQILERRRASDLVDKLLMDIYYNSSGHSHSIHNGSDCNSTTSTRSHKSWIVGDGTSLHEKHVAELSSLVSYLETHVERTGSVLVRRLKRRDALRRQQDAHCDVITGQLLKRAPEGASDPTSLRFTIQPTPGESGFSQWAAAMKMVAQLSGGIPPEFRRRLWLTLSDKHLAARGVDWPSVERSCFSEWSHPTDSELGVQIVKDLHRTGCSLFCGEDGQENQALLKRVLLAYARWNKAVGYCQGFNMLAALILQVTDKCETDALKLMIYLIEGVLPDSYFADSLRGLSVDMAVFRELLRTKLPRLSRHLDTLQNAAKDGTASYEPPLTNVFTMQWFLTLFCNCLPQPTVLRVWDLILLEGNEILLRTALAIWQTLEDRILGVRSADEFYCIMGVLTRELLEFGLLDANSLVKAVVTIGPLTELHNLREHYLYNINPWGAPLTPSLYSTNADKQLKPYPKERLVLDISALKQQYSKLKQRQRQAHIIFSAAISRQPAPSTPVAMNHLLLGKSALVPAKRLGPPKGSIPPSRSPPSTLLWKDTPRAGSTSSSSSDTELCDDPSDSSSSADEDENLQSVTKTTPQVEEASANGADLVVEDNILDQKDVVSETTTTQPTGSPPRTPISQTTVDSFLPDDNKSSSHIDDDNIFDNNTPPLPPPSSTSSHEIDFDAIKFEESDDDSVDFERFLEDRVRCLKEIDDTIDEERSESRAQLARRNSQRALQIIQENSLILHRIMQCQSRLSPSPPIVDAHSDSSAFPTHYNADSTIGFNEGFDKDDDVTGTESGVPPVSPSFTSQDYIVAGCSVQQDISPDPPPSRIDDSVFSNTFGGELVLDDTLNSSGCDKDDGSPESPEYGSRYTSILEKSRNLNEKYNSLILNANIKPLQPVSDSDSGMVSNTETSSLSNFGSDSKSVGATSNLGISVSPVACSSEFNVNQSSIQDIGGSYLSDSPCDLGLPSDSSGFYNFNLDKETKDKVKNSFSLDLVKDDMNFLSSSPVSSRTPTNRLSSLPPSSSPHLTVNFGEYHTGEDSSLKSNFTSPSIEEQSTRDEESQWKPAKSPVVRSPTARSPTARSPNESLKSPNKVFNPFPISLSSRQSKEVPLKLGLYKK